MITMDRVSFGYTEAKEILHDLDFRVTTGECVLLCGESGCGKTTVTKLVNGLIPHFTAGCVLKGKVTSAGLIVAETELYELARYVGSVFQNPKSQFFNLDSNSELTFGLENQGAAPSYMRTRIDKTVSSLAIDSLRGRNIFSMSGGEKQLLAFASVYAMDPVLYVLDEPTANLDQTAIERLREQLLLLKQQGHTVLIAEHRLWFLKDIVDRVVFMEDGRMKQVFGGIEFFALSEERRISLGLRSLAPVEGTLPPAHGGPSMEGLSVEGLCCAFGTREPIFSDLSFAALPGEVLAICGKNGVGKTTLIRCLCGLMKQQKGIVRLQGEPMKRSRRTKAAFCVMQDVNRQLFSDSVEGECRLTDHACDRRELEAVLGDCDLLPYAERHPMALSGGQKQRLAVATAVLSGKPLLIFDEPTSGLDYRHMMEVSSIVRRLAKLGKIVLVVTHDREFIQCTCDRILDMDRE